MRLESKLVDKVFETEKVEVAVAVVTLSRERPTIHSNSGETEGGVPLVPSASSSTPSDRQTLIVCPLLLHGVHSVSRVIFSVSDLR